MRPGGSKSGDDACVVTFAVPLADQIVCRAAEADAVMGPSPCAAVRTGHAPSTMATRSSSPGRCAAVGRLVPHRGGEPRSVAQPAAARSSPRGRLIWLRIHEGRAELVFPPLEIRHGARGGIALAVEMPPRAGRRRRSPRPSKPVSNTGICRTRHPGLDCRCFHGPDRGPATHVHPGSLGVERGARLRGRPPHSCGSTSSWFEPLCSPYSPHGNSLGLYHLACMLLVAALTALLGAVPSVLRDARRARAAAERSRLDVKGAPGGRGTPR